jgi:zinc protease
MSRALLITTSAAALAAFAMLLLLRTPIAQSDSDVFPYEVSEVTLDNSLKVIAIPYDSPGTVAFYTIVRTGSRDEVEPGHSGFAHFFEHMMFRGTETYSAEEYNDILKRAGADSNAFTTDDYTAYHITGPARELPTFVKLEADRFQNLRYTEDVFRTEALAVLGEYNKSASSPGLLLMEKLRDLAFDKHTYEHTTIGFLDDIKAMPEHYDYSLKFFDRYYRPDNTIVLVVGDLSPQDVFHLVRTHYGSWKPGYKPPHIEPEAPQPERRTGHISWPNPTRPYMMLGYHTPAFSTSDTSWPALDVISELLFSESAPLYQELVVAKQWVDALSGGAEDHRDPYLFTVMARVKSDDLVPQVKMVIDQHLQKLQSEPIEPRRVDAVKSHLRYSFALGLDSPASVARQVAHYLNLTRQVDTINRLYALYQRVDAGAVTRSAQQVFQAKNETMVTLSYQPPAKSARALRSDEKLVD